MVGGIFVLTLAQRIKCVSSSRYFIPSFKANWHKANEYCFFLGMRLALTDSVERHNAVVEEAKRSEVLDVAATVLWLGASDLGQEGLFYWHATGARVRFMNWRSDNPDDFGGVEDCVALVNIPDKGWHWHANDAGCEAEHYFICENDEHGQEIKEF
ncbi:hypothetical protein pipiens_019620 [Culex pipiens pipiens]|uniref:C-type lectin domain-containing protein n=1 Tax=Culex pipiens pipiens TaxID=38569 RepID=A0ABD1DSX3_CULPP